MAHVTIADRVCSDFEGWYNSLPVHKPSNWPARGTVAVALVVLEDLKDDFDLSLDSHRTAGRAQMKGVGVARLTRILAAHGETRPFLKEGGRTNRGGPGAIESMLRVLAGSELGTLPPSERSVVLHKLQRFLVDRIVEFHNRRRIKFTYDPSRTTWQAIHDLLRETKPTGKNGPLAQHLVGAKLSLRFPDDDVRNDSHSTADDQLGRAGDYQVGGTVFHVTVAPMPAVCEKCKVNLDRGLRAYLVAPDDQLAAARQMAESVAPGRITVTSVEAFVGQNVDEMSHFGRGVPAALGRLLRRYNERVDAVETDKSFLIDVPENL